MVLSEFKLLRRKIIGGVQSFIHYLFENLRKGGKQTYWSKICNFFPATIFENRYYLGSFKCLNKLSQR